MPSCHTFWRDRVSSLADQTQRSAKMFWHFIKFAKWENWCPFPFVNTEDILAGSDQWASCGNWVQVHLRSVHKTFSAEYKTNCDPEVDMSVRWASCGPFSPNLTSWWEKVLERSVSEEQSTAEIQARRDPSSKVASRLHWNLWWMGFLCAAAGYNQTSSGTRLLSDQSTASQFNRHSRINANACQILQEQISLSLGGTVLGNISVSQADSFHLGWDDYTKIWCGCVEQFRLSEWRTGCWIETRLFRAKARTSSANKKSGCSVV